METACDKDQSAREQGLPAVHKLKLLPEVMALLNRNTMQSAIVDPEHNFLLGVRYFLEPLGGDGSLPAYNIQRDIFTALSRLSIDQDALSASGLGKVVLFYTKSKKPEIGIKRMADKLLAEWSRPILKRSDDYKQRHVETRDFDFKYVYPVLLNCGFPSNTYVMKTELPNSDRKPVPLNSLSPNVQPPRSSPSAMQSANASWHLLMTATIVLASRDCPRRTRLRPRAHGMPRFATRTIVLSAQRATRLSAR